MKKKLLLLAAAFLALLIGTRLTDAQALEPDVPVSAQTIPNTMGIESGAKAAVVIDGKNGRVLFAKNANARLPMASTTKIMSAMLTLEQDELDTPFLVDTAAIHVEGSSMGLCEGDTVTLRVLAQGMLLSSGNDGANAAAIRIAGSREKFATLMNERACELGLEDTHFVTPSGLDDPEHYSSAYDLALLARKALELPQFAEICSQSSIKTRFGNPPYDRWLKNHNRLLKSYAGAIGVKTGFTDSAGRCLVSCAERDGVRLIAVTLYCSDDWNEHAALYDRYFAGLRKMEIAGMIPAVEIPVTGGMGKSVSAVARELEPVALMPEEEVEIQVMAEKFLYAPVRKNAVVGQVLVLCDGQRVGEIALTATTDIEVKTKRHFWKSLTEHFAAPNTKV